MQPKSQGTSAKKEKLHFEVGPRNHELERLSQEGNMIEDLFQLTWSEETIHEFGTHWGKLWAIGAFLDLSGGDGGDDKKKKHCDVGNN